MGESFHPPNSEHAMESQILLEDGPLLAVNKPGGLLTLGAIPGVPTLEREVKAYLKNRYSKAGNVYLGIPHRLDRPVSGVVVFSRNSKCAARLAEQFRERSVRKIYWAIVEGTPSPSDSELVDWLIKTPDESRAEIVPANTEGSKEARLHYRILRTGVPHPTGGPGCTLLEIELGTGRMHQIRVQLASRGWPIVGDLQYGSDLAFDEPPPVDLREMTIALHARSLTLKHPIRYDEVTITAPLPQIWERFGLHDDLPAVAPCAADESP